MEASISLICQSLGYSRQAYYKKAKMIQEERFKIEIVLKLIKETRQKMPRIGGKKLYNLLKDEFTKCNYKLGRDAFFEVLKEHNLLVKRRKSYVKTTNSFHRYHVYKNLIVELEIVRPNQVFVSDITYIRVAGGFMYLSLVTDLYSRRIMGWDLSNSLEAAGSIRALTMALSYLKDNDELIHHSDRGVQYCSNDYVSILIANNVKISMAEQGNPYENAVAERINGILKNEFFLDQDFISAKIAQKAIAQAIETYNEHRPHWSLDFDTPSRRYFESLVDKNSDAFSSLKGANQQQICGSDNKKQDYLVNY